MGNPAPFIDHTLLSPLTTAAEIARLCEEAVEAGFAAVCIPPSFARQAAGTLYGSEVAVATVIGFPLGYETTANKVFSAGEAVSAGATELDLVINQGLVAAGELTNAIREIQQVRDAADGVPLKVIIECCNFENRAKQELTKRLADIGIAMVKTSTGFGPGGATLEDVRLLVAAAAGRIGVKAAGGVRDWLFCEQLLKAGAARIGTSSGLTIIEQWSRQSGDV